MQRVLVLGCSGAGKSTLSRRLATITGLPRIELDIIHWHPGWVGTPREEWRALVATVAAGPAWIVDGNYFSTLDIVLPRADTVIWLDYRRHRCLRGVLFRTITNLGRVRDGGPEGCPERFNLEFLRYVWNFNAKSRPRLVAALEAHGSHARLHRLAGDRDAETLLSQVRQARAEIPDIAEGRP
jgi:adenylate kinase family enzyme